MGKTTDGRALKAASVTPTIYVFVNALIGEMERRSRVVCGVETVDLLPDLGLRNGTKEANKGKRVVESR